MTVVMTEAAAAVTAAEDAGAEAAAAVVEAAAAAAGAADGTTDVTTDAPDTATVQQASIATSSAAADPGTTIAGTAGGRLGLGLLWRPELAGVLRDEVTAGRLDFVEVIAESVGAVLPAALDGGTTVVPHGVGLGLGGAERPERGRLARLGDVADRCGAPLVSEHIAFVRADGIEAGHLLPLPRTREALDVLVANVREAADQLPVPLALEPIATLVEWPDAELTELAFLSELLDRTDVDLVLDVANILVNAANRRRAGGPDNDPMALIEGLPLDRVAYVHAAGGRIIDGRHHDTHTDPLWPEVATLVEELWSRQEIPGLLLERDGRFGDADLPAELAALAAAADRGRTRRVPRAPSPAARQPRPELAPSRQGLAATQSTFVRAVTGTTEPPPGFDKDDLAAVAQVLTHKRAEAVAHAAPDVAALPAFNEQFASWSRENPNRGGGGRSDAVRFLRSLSHRERTVHACRAAARIQSAHPGLHLWRNEERWVLALRLGPLHTVRAL